MLGHWLVLLRPDPSSVVGDIYDSVSINRFHLSENGDFIVYNLDYGRPGISANGSWTELPRYRWRHGFRTLRITGSTMLESDVWLDGLALRLSAPGNNLQTYGTGMRLSSADDPSCRVMLLPYGATMWLSLTQRNVSLMWADQYLTGKRVKRRKQSFDLHADLWCPDAIRIHLLTMGGSAVNLLANVSWSEALGNWPVFTATVASTGAQAMSHYETHPYMPQQCVRSLPDLVELLEVVQDVMHRRSTNKTRNLLPIQRTRKRYLSLMLKETKLLANAIKWDVQKCPFRHRNVAMYEASKALARAEQLFFMSGLCPPGTTVLQTAFGYRLCGSLAILDTEEHPVERTILDKGQWPDCNYIARMLPLERPECGLIVVGAHIGVCVVHAAAMGRPVLALEPDPRNLAILAGSLELVQDSWLPEFQVKVLNKAAAATKSKHRLFTHPTNSGAHSLLSNPGAGNAFVEVETVTLDSLVSNGDYCAAIIDVEGAEEDVLRGASKWLHARGTHAVMFEYTPQWLRQNRRDPLASFSILAGAGFELFRAESMDELFEEHGQVRPESWPELANASLDLSANFIARRKQNAVENTFEEEEKQEHAQKMPSWIHKNMPSFKIAPLTPLGSS